MLTPREAFAFGFHLRCAEENLDKTATAARIEKAAALAKQALPGWDQVTGLLSQGAQTAAGLNVLLPLAGGAAMGLGAAQLSEPSVEPEEAKTQELAATYRMFAEQLRQRNKLRNTTRPAKFFRY